MNTLRRLATVTAAAFVFASLASSNANFAHGGVTLSNAPTGSVISTFGWPDSQTYGQVFTAPITGTLDSFTLRLNAGVGEMYGSVGLWNGPALYATGYGESTNLYTSASVVSSSAGPYTFTPGVSVTAGQRYVAYMSVYGEPNSGLGTAVPLGTDAPGIDYFVWQNSSPAAGGLGPKNNASWNYFQDFGDLQFEATFTAVPEPSTCIMALAGVACGGFSVWRRRKRA